MNKLRWVLFWVTLVGMQPTWASIQEPLELVRETANQVLAKVTDRKQELNAAPEKIVELVTDIIVPHFDFNRMSQLVLGKYWRKASNSQKDEFVGQFQTLLIRTYAIALLNYSDQAIEYLPMHEQPDASSVTIKTEVKASGAPPIPINYRLHLKEGAWKVYDVIIDNISLVSNYRTGFSNEIRREGLNSLIAQLKEKNNKVTQ